MSLRDDSTETPPTTPLVSREELVTMVARAHHDSTYGESTLAGRALAAQSKLPKLVAENLGAGFGQWDFFPEPAEIVDFACAYVAPSNEEELWKLARAWASDDAAARRTVLALVGREILQHELRRIDVPKLRELFEARRPSQALEIRKSLGLDVPAAAQPKAEAAPKPARAPKPAAAPREIPTRMPKPAFVRPVKPAPPPPPKRFHHPKFGEGVLESQDGAGEEAKLTIKFAGGSRTLLARYVTEVPG